MLDKLFKTAGMAALVLGATALLAGPAAAQPHKAHRRHLARADSQRLVSDGPGTAYGFHRDPAPFRVGAWRRHYRGPTAVQETADIDAATSGGAWGFPGDSVYGEGKYSNYGVYSGAGGYGSPFFAGFYGPASGTDYGPFGQAYDDE